MTHNPASSQRPSRADPSRKQTLADPDRRTVSPAGAAPSIDRPAQHSARHVASPPPGQYTNYPSGFHNVPPSHHHPGQQAGSGFPGYGSSGPVDGYGYAGPPYHSSRPSVDSHHFARLPPGRANSQSSGSGSAPSSHDVMTGSHYPCHYSPSYPAASSNPSVGHAAGRTRWAWVPIEVPQAHLPDDAHLQYAPYPGAFYPSPTVSASTNSSSSHQSFQQPYSEGSHPGATPYGIQASSNFTPSYPYHPHPGHYGPPPGHTSHSQGGAPCRGSLSGSAQGGMPSIGAPRDSLSGGGGRRQSNQSGRPGNSSRKTSSNSSGNNSSPHRGVAPLPRRPPVSAFDNESGPADSNTLSSQPLDLVGEEVALEGAVLGADIDAETNALSDVTAAERVPGAGLRPHYHPQQGPRSDFVLWCGNVPQNATVDELWEVFSRLTPDEYRYWQSSAEAQKQAGDVLAEPDVEGHGVLSIFLISRSNCAFINYASPAHLDRAVKFFHGKQVRPHDPRCPKLVCRVRKKDDEAQAGVAGQRGRGIHVNWLKQQREQERTELATGEARLNDSMSPSSSTRVSTEPMSPSRKETAQVTSGLAMAGSYSSSGSASYTSTNSSLFRHPAFRHRYFILKSRRADDLDRSIETGYWATQPHNENVLDQAYRNSETVFLIFGVNQTGEFYGYAKMAGPIHTSTNDGKGKDEQRRRESLSSILSATSGNLPPSTIHEAADENASDTGAGDSSAASPTSDASTKRGHLKLDKRDFDTAKGLFGALSVDGVIDPSHPLAMMSPLPLSPSLEEADAFASAVSPQREDTITPRLAGSIAQSSTWPYTATRGTASEADSSERPKLASTLSADRPASRATAEPDKHGISRMDMATESTQTTSSQNDPPSLGPSDSVSWSSADPRMAEQIALRAVIHNLRLDEMESRGQAEQLESQLRTDSNGTDATVTVKKSGQEGATEERDTRTPPCQCSSDSWGKPFRVEWIRTDPLPFQWVKKLRNPWRDNRQVKVSRDGTELEPGVGRQLLEEWNKLHCAASVDSTRASKDAPHPTVAAQHTASEEDE
ncbi:hypothetical protein NDA11_007474 [Ustilago hordei]|nr:hypothetical protein NDA10_002380 [Ustilago hordei]KAJ1591239.1 hypothetical protein NDA11_007474 [Ustilago hordei]KAJ1600836.1 hypothetical protein NDA14_004193 [Ustilago hordei]UTT92991.1 hypothetical protein NDA17_000090 [Ustilago hordei]